MKKIYLILIIIILINFFNLSIIAESTIKEFKMALVTTPTQPMTIATHKFADLVNELTGGKVKINVFDSGVLGPEKEIFNSLQIGAIELVAVNYLRPAEAYKPLSVFQAPCLFKDTDHCLRVVTGPIAKELNNELTKSAGIRVLYTIYLGKTYFTSNKPIYKISDFSGLRFRSGAVTELFSAECRALNLTPITIPWGDLYMALQTNIVDMQENPLPSIISAKLYQVQKYVMDTGIRHYVSVGMINEDLFQSLDSEIQNILLEVGRIVTFYNNYLILEQESAAKDLLKEEGMVFIAEEDGLENNKIREAMMKQVWPQFIEEWGGQKLIDRIMSE